MSLQGISGWWDENPYAFSPEFRGYMEAFRPVEKVVENGG
jgi:hypothetical protein